MDRRELDNYRKLFEQHLARLGRDDIGVGEVADAGNGMLKVEFTKGTRHHEAMIPSFGLQDAEQARSTLSAALLKFSKAVEQQQIEAAKQE